MANAVKLSDSWQNFSAKERANYLLESGHLADCVFVIETGTESKKFKCHKLVLASASPFFECLLFGSFKEAKSDKEIALDGVTPENFKLFIQWAYHRDAEELNNATARDLMGLIDVARMYLAEPLLHECQKALTKQIDTISNNSLFIVFEYAYDKREEMLRKKVAETISMRVQQAWSSSTRSNNLIRTIPDILTYRSIFTMKWPIFYELLNLLKQGSNPISEVVRFQLIENYITNNKLQEVNDAVAQIKDQKLDEVDTLSDSASNISDISNVSVEEMHQDISALFKKNMSIRGNLLSNNEIINMLLHSIDFKKMTPKDFSNGPGMSNLLDVNKKYEILSNLCK